ncbi:hypothetical protein F4680DRAFT_422948, partial [Xylaria scruposa]
MCSDEAPKLFKELKRKLSDSLFDSPAQQFIDAISLNEVINPTRVKQILSSGEGENIPARKALVDFICESAPKVFAISVYIGINSNDLYKIMQSLKDCKFKDCVFKGDSGLPFSDASLEDNKSHSLVDHDMDICVANNFYQSQFLFLAPIIKVQDNVQNFHEKFPLPFTSVSEKSKGGGSFSTVFEVKIHEAHIDNLLHSSVSFAVKKVKAPRGEEISENEKRRIESTGKKMKKSTKTLRKIWEAEARALRDVGILNHPHIVKLVAAFTRGEDYCFMFELAEGGSLLDYWKGNPNIELTRPFVTKFFEQLRGLAEALHRLHDYKVKDTSDIKLINDLENMEQAATSTEEEESLDSIRHGDLKPANILVFPDSEPDSSAVPSLGTLKIADLGLAKRHVIATRYRRHGTSSRYGSIQYTAPEVSNKLPGAKLSRLYDMWSMGCIALEFLIWMLYGNDELKSFNAALTSSQVQQEHPFFQVKNRGMGARPEVHSRVTAWMDDMRRNDPACREGTAIGELLTFIKTGLLVVQLPPGSGHEENNGPVLVTNATMTDTDTSPTTRATAKVFRQKVDDILNKVINDENESYLVIGNRHEISKPSLLAKKRRPSTLNLAADAAARTARTPSTISAVMDSQVNLNLTEWEFYIDKGEIATESLTQRLDELVATTGWSPWPLETEKICSQCSKLKFTEPHFSTILAITYLKQGATTCRLCALLWKVCEKFEGTKSQNVQFERFGSILTMNGVHSIPVMSIFRSPDYRALDNASIQLGLPKLLALKKNDDEVLSIEEKALFGIVGAWLKHCDDNHPNCKPENPKLPTRLLYIGTIKKPVLRITESKKIDTSGGTPRYIALSHPWGDRNQYPPFETLRSNYDEYMNGIVFNKLTLTFKHAVKATRALGIEYLWIDSICIIQGPDGDWATQAGLMEAVYSSAYCVLAASRATSQYSGFLHERDDREFVGIPQKNGGSLYLCEFADDFTTHVLKSHHASRGWVLQERALASRSVYFSDTQTYWECGDGIRCETMTKMHNSLVAFLGDPRFPRVATRNHGERITLYQYLFKIYTRLGLSYVKDRPEAIRGLEDRLRTAFQAKGQWGILDHSPEGRMLHRSLLWYRGNETSALTDINFEAAGRTAVPSWSWMSRAGPIIKEEVDPDTGEPKVTVDPCSAIEYVHVEGGQAEWEDRVRSPWVPRAADQQPDELVAEASCFGHPDPRTDPQAWLVWDDETKTRDTRGKHMCVVVGRGVAAVALTASMDQAVGRAAASDNKNRLHYVLIVEPLDLEARSMAGRAVICRRIGAGVLLGKHLIGEEKTVRI